jgi:hypothetical protein
MRSLAKAVVLAIAQHLRQLKQRQSNRVSAICWRSPSKSGVISKAIKSLDVWMFKSSDV